MMSNANNDREARVYPHNVEAEQALLGAILINNDALDRCDGLTAEQFYEPLHGRIFTAIYAALVAGQRATPVTLKSQFEGETVEKNLTVAQYLGRLVAHATSVINARDYARTIRDLWVRRELLGIIAEASEMACAVGEIDSADLLDIVETQLFALGGYGGDCKHEATAPEAIESTIAMIDRAYQHDGKLAGLSSGFGDLDKRLGGLAPENLYIVAGRPSMGKSALAANIAFNVAKLLLGTHKLHGRDGDKMGEVSFYSLEMSIEQLFQRQLAAETGVPADCQRRGDVNEVNFRQLVEAGRGLAELPIHVDSTGSLSIGQLMARARKRKRLYDTRLIVVDYLQLMITGQRRRDNRVAEVSEISMALKALAKELKIPVIALSQLSRQVESREDKRPILSDLRESGAIEQDADVVMFVFREEYYLQRAEPSPSEVEKYQAWSVRMAEVAGKAEVILAKHRHAGIGAVRMSFDGARTAFCDLAPGGLF